MRFEWHHWIDERVYETLNKLVKYSEGIYKSAKQKRFVEDMIKTLIEGYCNRTHDLEEYGVELKEGQKLIPIFARVRFGKARHENSNRAVVWTFVIDEFGVVAKRRHGLTRGKVDHKKTKIEFQRDEHAGFFIEELKKSLREEQDTQKKAQEKRVKGQYIGEIGERREFAVKVINVFEYHTAYGTKQIFIMEDEDGNVLKWTANQKRVFGINTRLKFKATIKAHEEYRGIKQTVIIRPRFHEIDLSETRKKGWGI